MILYKNKELHCFGIILLIAISFVSCNKFSNEIDISSTNFGDEVALRQNLIFTFSDHVVPEEDIDQWSDEAYITFDPPVAGRFKFNTTRELMFSPLNGFNPGTNYKATLTERVVEKSPSGKPLGSNKTISFHTPFLQATQLDLFWTESTSGSGQPMLLAKLVFNYEVDPAELESRLKFSLNGALVSYNRISDQVTSIVTLALVDINSKTAANQPITARIEPGLRCIPCSSPSEQNYELGTTIPDVSRLDILEVLPIFQDREALIRVRTNQKLRALDLRSAIRFEPTMNIQTEITEDGFIIRGGFKSGSAYTLSISNQIRGVLGGVMASSWQGTVAFGEMEPEIRFTSAKGFYLSNRGSKSVALEIVNIPSVKARVFKIYENNLMNYIRSNRYSRWYENSNAGLGTNFGNFDYSTYDIEQYGDLILDRTYQSKDLIASEGRHILTLDILDDSRHKGVYLVHVASTENQWLGAWRMISYSDIGLIVKATPDEVLVFANSIMDTSPIAGAEISLISSNNQLMMTGTTDAKGIAKITGLRKEAAGFRLGMVSARTNKDFNLIVLSDTEVERSRFEIGGQYSNESGYQAYLYPERDIYRPGETIHLNAIVRDTDWKNPGQIPVILQLRLPNGKEWRTQQSLLSDQGSAQFSISLDPAAVTGTYMAELYSSNRILLASQAISVEEFLPDRIKVTLETNSNRYKHSSPIQTTIRATNLYGPPASFRNYEVTMNYQRMPFASKNHPNHHFDMKIREGLTLSADLREGKTDAAGRGIESFGIEDSWKDLGLLRGRIFATVFDESGRPVNQIKDITIQTQDVFYGIKRIDPYVDLARPLEFGFIALNADANPVPATAKIQIVRFDWQNVIQRTYDERFRYVSEKKETVVIDRIIDLRDGTGVLNFLPQISGEYEVRILRPGSQHWVALPFYAYGFGYTRGSSFQVDTDGHIIIEADKSLYKPGETAKILFKTPFSGKLIVTVERNRVLETYSLQTDQRAAVLNIPIKDQHVPNVYVSATLIKPLTDTAVPLTTAHGFQSINVERSKSKLPVKITAPATSRSNKRQSITINAGVNTTVEMTVAVVDEGILQLKNFKSPDPHSFFYAKRALEVSSFDLYPYLFPELRRRSSTGGDGYDLSMRVNPMGTRRARLVSFWSGLLKTNGQGQASYTFDIPAYSGSLRVMAVAWNRDAFGSAEHRIRVADPIVMTAALPRFLSPSDSLNMSMILTNTLNQASRVDASITVSGAARIRGSSTQTISLSALEEKAVPFQIVALQQSGEAIISLSARNNGETYRDTVRVPVRSASGLTRESGYGQVSSGAKTISFKEPMVAGTATGRLLISRSPLIQYSKSLSDLLAYPYGCAEQTISAAFPQLYFEDISTFFEHAGSRRPSDPTYNIQEAIRKIETMQLYSGGLSYWPGGAEESWWASVYGAHFLIEAQKAGYEVNSTVLQRLLWYIELKNRENPTVRYAYYDGNNQLREKTIAPKELMYGIYVLALGGQADLPGMNYYKDNLSLLALDSRYLLAASFMQIGDEASYKAILPQNASSERSAQSTGGDFSSPIRDLALILNSLLESDPQHAQIVPMGRRLSEQVAQAKYLNTQEMAFSMMAMGKILRAESNNTATASIRQGSRTLGNFTGKELKIDMNPSQGAITMTASGNGSLYYFWDTKGLGTSNTTVERDQTLQVRRTFMNRSGQVLNTRSFRQSDLIVVRIGVRTTDASRMENVVVTDMLPAGFEIENPRIGSVPELQWITNSSTPDHMDIRDDRIHFFTSVDGTEKYFYYLVRAVSKGRFFQGPVSADAMYNGAYHSYHGSGIIQISAQ